jgi:RecB family exonuclease
MTDPSPNPVRHVIVTLADWIANAEGLFVADFDLLSRIPGLESLDIVATEKLLQSGFHQRLHDWLPGIDEVDFKSLGPYEGGASGTRSPGQSHEPWSTYRDREEELVAVARQLKSDRRNGSSVALNRVGIVYKHPLPYLYLARDVFGSAGIPYQTGDTLPLAAEPTSAALDLIMEAVEANFTRSTTVALLRSPHFRFTLDGESSDIVRGDDGEGDEVSREAIAALDCALGAARYLGDPARLESLSETWKDAISAPALHLAIRVTRELAPLAAPARASAHVRHLAAFWERHLRSIDGDQTELASRERRARAAIADTLNTLAAVHERHDDPSWTVEDLALAVRRRIEDQTVEVDAADRGLQLLDDNAARYSDFDDLTIVGLVEPEWPERPKRNIFYPSSLLKALGWPSEKDRQAAAEANFLDLVASPSRRTMLSTFTLDDDALVSRSVLLGTGVPSAASALGLGTGVLSAPPAEPPPLAARVFVDEALSLDPVSIAPLDTRARAWASLRASRTPSDSDQFHGVIATASDQPSSFDRNGRPWSVSALETYLGCPFRFFARHILKLEEETEDEEVMDPRRQGQFLHEVFEEFFAAWQSAGHGAIDSNNIDEARRVFTAVVDRKLTELPGAEAGLERTRLLGSPAAAGLGEAVMRMEAERPTPVIERLLEHELRGEFTFTTSGGPRRIALRGKADRVDLLADGTFRLIDYKLGWPPDRKKALQLPVYGLCAEQWLRANRGGDWSMSEAAYLAFKGPRRVVPLFQSDADRDKVLAEAQDRLAETVDAIAHGQFPPAPDDVHRCETCGYVTVCRKDYVGDV